MWDNEEWAKNHIQKKRKITPLEAWEVVFEGNPPPVPMISPDQLNYPPFTRYWLIGKTKKGKLLFVAWEKHRETLNLITAFEPNQERIELYEKLKKKHKKR
jgi:uncharacterized DUF497 family protein